MQKKSADVPPMFFPDFSFLSGEYVALDRGGLFVVAFARHGECCCDHAPFGHWKTATFIAEMCLSGLAASWELDGPMNGEACRVYISEVLASTLEQADCVVMDNRPAHKVVGIRGSIAAKGAQIIYRHSTASI